MVTRPTISSILAAGITIGIGMGGFVDGIVFHQILQLHNMLSARIPTGTLVGAKINMVWDGIFHALVWIITAIGIAMLWSTLNRSTARLSGWSLFGSTLIGWGLFNIVEGLIDHHILNLHHVYEPLGQSVWDWLFLLFGALLIVAGLIIVRRVESDAHEA